jgi:hypothetical protein
MAEVKLLVTLKPASPDKGSERQFLGVGGTKEAAIADAAWVAQNLWFTHSVVVVKVEPLSKSSNKAGAKAGTAKTTKTKKAAQPRAKREPHG